jgi:dephospho-CoA kinase
LTGGIGCGKSTVGQLFADLGAAVIDTDAISHALTQPDAAGFTEIVRQFGADFVLPRGGLDRAKLRALVFSDTAAKARLEAILHPLILAQVRTELHLCRAPYALIVVPLLFESGHYLPLVQRTLVVDCDETSQVQRSMARSRLSETEVRAIMAHQLPRNARLKQADDIIRNESDLQALRSAVATLHERYCALAIAHS